MFRQVRAYIANDSDGAGDACKVAESLQCSDGIVQDGGGVAPGNDLVDDKAIKKRADDSDARVSEFVCSSGIHRASLGYANTSGRVQIRPIVLPAQQLRQLGDVGGDAPGLVDGQPLRFERMI